MVRNGVVKREPMDFSGVLAGCFLGVLEDT
jgi:hypothetical protein